MFQSGRIGADEEIDEFKGMTEQEVQEIMEEREAKANAQILAMVYKASCLLAQEQEVLKMCDI